MSLTSHVIGLAPLLFAPASGGVAVFHGPSGGPGSVIVHDESGGGAQPVAELADVRLEPIDACGRTALHEFAPDEPRTVDDVPGASRVALPGGRGSIYAFSRSDAAGPTSFGFFHVDAQGEVRVLIERPALPLGLDPFLDRIAVAPDGGAILVATLSAGGGDLYEIDLAAHAVVERTAAFAPLDFGRSGLALESSFGCAVDVHGILRFERGSGGDAALVPFESGATPAWFARQIVTSRNGAWAATIAGDSSVAERAYVFGRVGDARAVSDSTDRISNPGFLPEVRNGPWLAVSDDGQYVAWRSELSTSGYGAELFVANVAAAEPPLHVTADPVFEPYLDEIGQFVFGLSSRLYFLAGDASVASPLGVERADAFEVVPGGSTFAARNLTATSGQSSPPFTLYGELVPERVFWKPQTASFVMYAHDGSELALIETSPGSSQAYELIDELAAFDVLGASAETLIVSHFGDDELDEPDFHAIPAAYCAAPEEIAELDATTAILRSAVRADGAVVVVTAGAVAQYVWRLDAATGTVERMTARGFVYGPSVSFSPGGAVVASIGALGSPSIFVIWPDGGPPRRLAPGTFAGFVLPGV